MDAAAVRDSRRKGRGRAGSELTGGLTGSGAAMLPRGEEMAVQPQKRERKNRQISISFESLLQEVLSCDLF